MKMESSGDFNELIDRNIGLPLLKSTELSPLFQEVRSYNILILII
jgi:hypothetical protein